MYTVFGFSTQNTLKVLYVLEQLGLNYEFNYVNLMKGEQKDPSFQKINPVGKTPVLVHDGQSLFESGAICRYLANVETSDLYPVPAMKRAKVDQWMDYFTCHLGRWLNELNYQYVIKKMAGRGEPDMNTVEEARTFVFAQAGIVNGWLEKNTYLCGDSLTIADLFAFAYVEQAKAVHVDLSPYPALVAWHDRLEALPSVQNARTRLRSYA
ncbi:MAG: glutathione S-transferase family protein [Bdellovibrionota bacterium]